MKTNLKPLPLSRQTFKTIIEKNKLYVDKTEEIYKLLENESVFYFLSRPRRFGKSLLVSTLESIFKGEKELFKDLWIYDKIDFKKYPVIKLSLNDLNYAEGIKEFKESLFYHLSRIYNEYNIEIKTNDYVLAFKNLIQELSKIEKVVLLIDEYDKPIIEYLGTNFERAKEMRSILKNFYETIKANDQYLHFVFLTGVSKFSKTSIFSTLNNLIDITTNKKYANIVGINEKQLYSYFDEYIKILAKEKKLSIEELKIRLKKWYNGYSWDGKSFLYNPYSLLNVFDSGEIKNYWFSTGSPTFLLKTIKEYNIDIRKFEKMRLSEKDFDSFDVDNMNVNALLFQTGYLTIKQIEEIDEELEYTLSYPNEEVRKSMLDYLLDYYAYQQISNDISVNEMVKKLKINDMDGLRDIFKTIFGTIAVKMQPNTSNTVVEREFYYHTIFYLIFILIGSKIQVEIATSHGFADAVIETNKYVYIFEFKMTTATAGLKQIERKKYYESYLAKNKDIFFVGVSFDSENKNIKEWKSKQLVINKN
ncbi:MAG: AAA family ATPase [Candidatus Sericytochromatia bacterium]